jgi:hypothetical protein
VGAEQYTSGSLWFCDLVLLASAMFFIPATLASLSSIKHRSLVPLTLLVFLGLFMTTPASLPIWDHFTLLQKTQFPWRWLAIISMSGAVISGLGFESLSNFFVPQKRPTAILIGGLVLAGTVFTATQIIRPVNYISPQAFVKLTEPLLEAKSYECWWPVWANKKALSIREKVSVKDRTNEIETWQPAERTINFEAGEPQMARIATFWYPRWQAEVNGSPVEVAHDENGAILIPIPAEKATAMIWIQETWAYRVAGIVSGIIWLLLLSALAFYRLGLSLQFRTKSPLLAEEEFL